MSDPTKIYRCPNCCYGQLPDGKLAIGPGYVDYLPGTTCPACQGSGFVYVTPAPRVLSDRQEDTPSDEEIDYYRWETP